MTPSPRLVIPGLLIATVIAYLPAFFAGFIWDDPEYVSQNPLLRSFDGLWAIWFRPEASPQYYPLVFTSFWIEYQLWGLDRPGGYHATNILLHALGGILLWRVLTRLGIPGATLAAFIWTLHPVQVESVAWITERKNTLSAVFYFASALMCVRWLALDGSFTYSGLRTGPQTRTWVIALVLFVFALLSKTVTASLPAAMLLLVWWKRGRITRSDVAPLLPFFAIGLVMGLATASLEQDRVGATGYEWDYAATLPGEIAHRILIAGRAVWFYLGTIIWPVELAFFYERWDVSIRVWWQWLYPAAVVLTLVALWLARRRVGRGPLVAALFFGGTLFPALGFFNVFPHRYSFVADHFQHLASVAPIVLIAAGVARVGRERSALVVLSAVLGSLTFMQSRIYRNVLTLWQDTVEKSPGNWAAWTNLGKAQSDANMIDQAIASHRRALELNDGVADTWFNIAMVHGKQRDYLAARDALKQALSMTQERSVVRVESMLYLSRVEEALGNHQAMFDWLDKAIEAEPEYPPTQARLAELLRTHGPAQR
jgi:hypothetical protein